MKYLIYIISLILIFAPIIICLGINMNEQDDLIVHDPYIGIGKFDLHAKTCAYLSIFIGIVLYSVGKKLNSQRKKSRRST